MKTLHPAGHRVLVKLKKIEEKTASGIVLSTEHTKLRDQRAMQEAYVIELGMNAFKAYDDGTPWCKVGDLVMISKYAGEDSIDNDTKDVYRVINDEDIFAIVEETNE